MQDPDPHGSALVCLNGIRVRIETNADPQQ
jgi:hypothetical protein